MISTGTMLKGFCRGYFGRDSYEDKIVEATGVDWIVAREVDSGKVVFTNTSPKELRKELDSLNTGE